MSGCTTCGYVGGMSMMKCKRHCRPCHIYCSCPAAFDEVMEIRERLRHVDGYAWTLYDRFPERVPPGKVLSE